MKNKILVKILLCLFMCSIVGLFITHKLEAYNEYAALQQDNLLIQVNSLEFKGSGDHVSLNNPWAGEPNTFEAWVNIPSSVPNTRRVGIIAGNYAQRNNINWEVHTNGRPRIWWNNGQVDWHIRDIDLRTDQWLHLAFVRDKSAGKMYFYLNGSLEATRDGVGSDVIPATASYIGGDRRGSNSPWFHGHIAEIRIWNNARTQTQISNNMGRPLSGNEPGLLGYYNFTEGSGTILHDSSPFKNHGTITKAKWGGPPMIVEPTAPTPEPTPPVDTGTIFSDLDPGHWAYDNIMEMVERGILSGYPDGTFRPNNVVTRAEFAKIMVLTLELQTARPASPSFVDVGTDHWAFEDVESAKNYLTGYQDRRTGELSFMPGGDAVREDVAVAIVKAQGYGGETANLSLLNQFPDQGEISDALRDHVAIAVGKGYMQGTDIGFEPQKALTRAEACTLLLRIIQAELEKVTL